MWEDIINNQIPSLSLFEERPEIRDYILDTAAKEEEERKKRFKFPISPKPLGEIDTQALFEKSVMGQQGIAPPASTATAVPVPPKTKKKTISVSKEIPFDKEKVLQAKVVPFENFRILDDFRPPTPQDVLKKPTEVNPQEVKNFFTALRGDILTQIPDYKNIQKRLSLLQEQEEALRNPAEITDEEYKKFLQIKSPGLEDIKAGVAAGIYYITPVEVRSIKYYEPQQSGAPKPAVADVPITFDVYKVYYKEIDGKPYRVPGIKPIYYIDKDFNVRPYKQGLLTETLQGVAKSVGITPTSLDVLLEKGVRSLPSKPEYKGREKEIPGYIPTNYFTGLFGLQQNLPFSQEYLSDPGGKPITAGNYPYYTDTPPTAKIINVHPQSALEYGLGNIMVPLVHLPNVLMGNRSLPPPMTYKLGISPSPEETKQLEEKQRKEFIPKMLYDLIASVPYLKHKTLSQIFAASFVTQPFYSQPDREWYSNALEGLLNAGMMVGASLVSKVPKMVKTGELTPKALDYIIDAGKRAAVFGGGEFLKSQFFYPKSESESLREVMSETAYAMAGILFYEALGFPYKKLGLFKRAPKELKQLTTNILENPDQVIERAQQAGLRPESTELLQNMVNLSKTVKELRETNPNATIEDLMQYLFKREKKPAETPQEPTSIEQKSTEQTTVEPNLTERPDLEALQKRLNELGVLSNELQKAIPTEQLTKETSSKRKKTEEQTQQTEEAQTMPATTETATAIAGEPPGVAEPTVTTTAQEATQAAKQTKQPAAKPKIPEDYAQGIVDKTITYVSSAGRSRENVENIFQEGIARAREKGKQDKQWRNLSQTEQDALIWAIATHARTNKLTIDNALRDFAKQHNLSPSILPSPQALNRRLRTLYEEFDNRTSALDMIYNKPTQIEKMPEIPSAKPEQVADVELYTKSGELANRFSTGIDNWAKQTELPAKTITDVAMRSMARAVLRQEASGWKALSDNNKARVTLLLASSVPKKEISYKDLVSNTSEKYNIPQRLFPTEEKAYRSWLKRLSELSEEKLLRIHAKNEASHINSVIDNLRSGGTKLQEKKIQKIKELFIRRKLQQNKVTEETAEGKQEPTFEITNSQQSAGEKIKSSVKHVGQNIDKSRILKVAQHALDVLVNPLRIKDKRWDSLRDIQKDRVVLWAALFAPPEVKSYDSLINHFAKKYRVSKRLFPTKASTFSERLKRIENMSDKEIRSLYTKQQWQPIDVTAILQKTQEQQQLVNKVLGITEKPTKPQTQAQQVKQTKATSKPSNTNEIKVKTKQGGTNEAIKLEPLSWDAVKEAETQPRPSDVKTAQDAGDINKLKQYQQQLYGYIKSYINNSLTSAIRWRNDINSIRDLVNFVLKDYGHIEYEKIVPTKPEVLDLVRRYEEDKIGFVPDETPVVPKRLSEEQMIEYLTTNLFPKVQEAAKQGKNAQRILQTAAIHRGLTNSRHIDRNLDNLIESYNYWREHKTLPTLKLDLYSASQLAAKAGGQSQKGKQSEVAQEPQQTTEPTQTKKGKPAAKQLQKAEQAEEANLILKQTEETTQVKKPQSKSKQSKETTPVEEPQPKSKETSKTKSAKKTQPTSKSEQTKEAERTEEGPTDEEIRAIDIGKILKREKIIDELDSKESPLYLHPLTVIPLGTLLFNRVVLGDADSEFKDALDIIAISTLAAYGAVKGIKVLRQRNVFSVAKLPHALRQLTNRQPQLKQYNLEAPIILEAVTKAKVDLRSQTKLEDIPEVQQAIQQAKKFQDDANSVKGRSLATQVNNPLAKKTYKRLLSTWMSVNREISNAQDNVNRFYKTVKSDDLAVISRANILTQRELYRRKYEPYREEPGILLPRAQTISAAEQQKILIDSIREAYKIFFKKEPTGKQLEHYVDLIIKERQLIKDLGILELKSALASQYKVPVDQLESKYKEAEQYAEILKSYATKAKSIYKTALEQWDKRVRTLRRQLASTNIDKNTRNALLKDYDKLKSLRDQFQAKAKEAARQIQPELRYYKRMANQLNPENIKKKVESYIIQNVWWNPLWDRAFGNLGFKAQSVALTEQGYPSGELSHMVAPTKHVEYARTPEEREAKIKEFLKNNGFKPFKDQESFPGYYEREINGKKDIVRIIKFDRRELNIFKAKYPDISQRLEDLYGVLAQAYKRKIRSISKLDEHSKELIGKLKEDLKSVPDAPLPDNDALEAVSTFKDHITSMLSNDNTPITELLKLVHNARLDVPFNKFRDYTGYFLGKTAKEEAAAYRVALARWSERVSRKAVNNSIVSIIDGELVPEAIKMGAAYSPYVKYLNDIKDNILRTPETLFEAGLIKSGKKIVDFGNILNTTNDASYFLVFVLNGKAALKNIIYQAIVNPMNRMLEGHKWSKTMGTYVRGTTKGAVKGLPWVLTNGALTPKWRRAQSEATQYDVIETKDPIEREVFRILNRSNIFGTSILNTLETLRDAPGFLDLLKLPMKKTDLFKYAALKFGMYLQAQSEKMNKIMSALVQYELLRQKGMTDPKQIAEEIAYGIARDVGFYNPWDMGELTRRLKGNVIGKHFVTLLAPSILQNWNYFEAVKQATVGLKSAFSDQRSRQLFVRSAAGLVTLGMLQVLLGGLGGAPVVGDLMALIEDWKQKYLQGQGKLSNSLVNEYINKAKLQLYNMGVSQKAINSVEKIFNYGALSYLTNQNFQVNNLLGSSLEPFIKDFAERNIRQIAKALSREHVDWTEMNVFGTGTTNIARYIRNVFSGDILLNSKYRSLETGKTVDLLYYLTGWLGQPLSETIRKKYEAKGFIDFYADEGRSKYMKSVIGGVVGGIGSTNIKANLMHSLATIDEGYNKAEHLHVLASHIYESKYGDYISTNIDELNKFLNNKTTNKLITQLLRHKAYIQEFEGKPMEYDNFVNVMRNNIRKYYETRAYREALPLVYGSQYYNQFGIPIEEELQDGFDSTIKFNGRPINEYLSEGMDKPGLYYALKVIEGIRLPSNDIELNQLKEELMEHAKQYFKIQ